MKDPASPYFVPDDQQVLANFLAGALHQDWNLEFNTPELALKAALDAESGSYAEDVLTQLERVAQASPTDDFAVVLHKRFGVYVVFENYGMSAQQWLDHVGHVVREHLGRGPDTHSLPL